MRLAVIRAGVAVGAYAVLVVELASAFGALTRPTVGTAWLLSLCGATLLAITRWRRDAVAHNDVARRSTDVARRSTDVARRRTDVAGHDGGDATAETSRSTLERWRAAWHATTRAQRGVMATLLGLLVAELILAVLAEPNNYDSQTYHLPKIERWVAQGGVEFFATAIHRQVTLAPGAEYLVAHLRLLTGGDALHNLVQWVAGVGCLAGTSRIAAQLGGGLRAQLLTAFLVGTTPMVVLQASSTQTDLVTAAWVGCVATLTLDGLHRRADLSDALFLGLAAGLTTLTKTSGALTVGPLLGLWAAVQLRRALRRPGHPARWRQTAHQVIPRANVGPVVRSVVGVAGPMLVVVAGATAIAGPFVARVQAEFGHALGPAWLRETVAMQRHDPAAVLVNALRIGHTALDTPFAPLRDAGAFMIVAVADWVDVNPQDQSITFASQHFPVAAWYPDEDRVAFPLQGGLIMISLVSCLTRPRRIANPLTQQAVSISHKPPQYATTRAMRGYALVCTAALMLHASAIKWQPWGNRLLLSVLVVSAPLAGLWLDAVLRRSELRRSELHRSRDDRSTWSVSPPRSALRAPVAALLVTTALSGVLAVSYGFPRRLVGTGSTVSTGEWETRFARRPAWAAEFRWAAEQVTRSGARRVGLVERNDDWEYPWWLLLRGRDIVALQSVVPKHPPAAPASVDAIVCTGTRAVCARYVPPGWQLEFRKYVGYALPSDPFRQDAAR